MLPSAIWSSSLRVIGTAVLIYNRNSPIYNRNSSIYNRAAYTPEFVPFDALTAGIYHLAIVRGLIREE